MFKIVNVGKLDITGSIDTKAIEAGFRRVSNNFKSVGGLGKSLNSDLERMKKSAKGVALSFGAASVVGAGFLVNLAKSAPAVAATMAKIQIETERLGRGVGQTLKPEFESFARLYTKFVNFAIQHPIGAALGIGATTVAGLAAAKGLVGLLASAMVSASVLTALAYLAVIAGAGYGLKKAGDFVTDKIKTYVGAGGENTVSDISGQDVVYRLPSAIKSSITGKPAPYDNVLNPISPAHANEIENIKRGGFQQTPSGAINAAKEEDRKWILLNLIDWAWT